MAQTNACSPEARASRMSLGSRLLLAMLLVTAAAFTQPRSQSLSASDPTDEAPEPAATLYTFSITMGDFELSMDLEEDGSAALVDGSELGTWTAGVESDDYTVSVGGSDWVLVGVCLIEEGGSGVLQSEDGIDVGAWTLLEIHSELVGDLLYNLEFVDDTIFVGTFETEVIDGEVHEIAVGEGNSVEVVSAAGSDIVTLGDGCHVFITGGDVGVLAIQDPQDKPKKKKPQKPQRGIRVTPPKGYQAGKWKLVNEPPKGGCFVGSPFGAAGRNCGNPAKTCAAVVIHINANGIPMRDTHLGACGNPANHFKVLGSGGLWVGF